MVYLDRLQHNLDIDQAMLPRCSLFDNMLIEKLASLDSRGDVAGGVVEFGNLQVISIFHM